MIKIKNHIILLFSLVTINTFCSKKYHRFPNPRIFSQKKFDPKNENDLKLFKKVASTVKKFNIRVDRYNILLDKKHGKYYHNKMYQLKLSNFIIKESKPTISQIYINLLDITKNLNDLRLLIAEEELSQSKNINPYLPLSNSPLNEL